ncbi:MAG TPA: hypothetical protein VGP48_14965 [Stellaceae bacterium]|jgi:hypothetical protein|nr:hypothetical protein [Stellaceae bacterium]
MAYLGDVNNANYWRRLAAEARDMADGAADRHVRDTLIGIAEGYERIAARVATAPIVRTG